MNIVYSDFSNPHSPEFRNANNLLLCTLVTVTNDSYKRQEFHNIYFLLLIRSKIFTPYLC